MGKNLGGKNKKKSKKVTQSNRELVIKEGDDQEYAYVIRLLGDSRLEVKCADGVTRMGFIRGSMKKRVWIGQGDIILIALREYEKDKCDIILKYTPEEVVDLKNNNQLPEDFKINNTEKDEFNNDDYDLELDFIKTEKTTVDKIIPDMYSDEEEEEEKNKQIIKEIKKETNKGKAKKEVFEESKEPNIDDI
jgi:translation initiation factor 1A